MADEQSQDDVDSMFDEAPADDAPEDNSEDISEDNSEDASEDAPEDEPEGASEESAEEAEGDAEGRTEGANSADYEDYDDLDLEDIDFPDDDFDEDFDEEGGGDSKKKWILIGSAVFVVVAALSGGAMFFLGGDEEETAHGDLPEAVLSLKIPKKSKMKMGQSAPRSSRLQPGGAPSPAPDARGAKPATGPTQSAPTGAPAPAQAQASAQAPAAAATPPIASRPRTQAGAGLIVPSVTAAAFKGFPMMQNPKPLPGPDKSLGESTGGGVIPIVSKDGRQPWQAYAKPFSGEATLARIGIIIKGLGFSRAATVAAINHTPAEVTLAFDPYAKNVGDWVGLARTAGHETLIPLPMEPADFPNSDPGPFALQTDLQQEQNLDRLRYILSVSMGNVGLLQMMGTRFATSQQALAPVLQEIRARGLLMIDDGLVKNSQIVSIASTIALPRARSDVFIDQDPSRLGIARGLSKLEAAALKNKSAIGIAQSLPTTLSNIMAWSKTLAGKKMILAPVSAIVKISGSGQPANKGDATTGGENGAAPKQAAAPK
ncbi:MAG: hypothetical protein HN884_06330 [Rhodospirillaceae bacterium]|nr:hypothetical protein [Rhodospirillaceae bacterium]